MIARLWHGIALSENVPAYMQHFNASVLPELREISGFQEAYVMQRPVDDAIELTVVTLWESMDAIRSFAGDNPETAVVEPAAQAVLQTYDTRVTHYEVVLHTE